MNRSITTEITIAAPPDRVWSVLTDLGSYPDWNPFIVQAEGSAEVGERLALRMVAGADPGGRAMTIRPKVLAASPSRELRWIGHLGVPGIFDGEHAFELEDLKDGRTRLVQSEHFRGVLVPLMRSFLEVKTRAGFDAMNRSLKDRVQALQGQSQG